MTASTETPEQRAEAIASKVAEGSQRAKHLIAAAITAAVAAEREACAQKVLSLGVSRTETRERIAAAIRSRP